MCPQIKHILNMKRYLLYITGILLLLVTSCVKEPGLTGPLGEELPVTLTLSLPLDSGTRSLTDANESDFPRVDVLAFVKGSDGVFRYAYTAPQKSINSGSLPLVTIVVEARTHSREQIFMILGNATAGMVSAITLNMNLATAQSALVLTQANEWNSTSSSNFDPLPMYAQTTATVITTTTPGIGTYDWLRMHARIDLRLKSSVSNFEITEAHLFNRYDRGNMATDFLNSSVWDASGHKVLQTNIPASAARQYLPSYYGVSSDYYANTPYKATGTGTAAAIIRSIYTFEAPGVTDAKRLEATAIVVGGKFNSSPTTTYYRIDIKTASTPAGNVSQDILRNHLYDIEIQSVAGPGADTPEDAFKGEANMVINTTITPWNNVNLSGDIEGPVVVPPPVSPANLVPFVSDHLLMYKSGQSATSFNVAADAAWKIKAIDCPGDVVLGLSVNETGTNKTISVDASGASYVDPVIVTIVFECTVPNTGYIGGDVIDLGGGAFANTNTYTLSFSVGEYVMVAPTSRWAGSNIYWDGSKLTFDLENNAKQGVYFRYGSLVGFSPNGIGSSPSAVWSSLTIYDPLGVNPTSWATIPYYTADASAYYNNYNRHLLLEVHNPATGIGDICKYISDLGDAPDQGQWRIPTRTDLTNLLNSSPYERFGPFTPIVGSDNAADGTTLLSSYMQGTTSGIIIPASGYGALDNGRPVNPGTYVRITSATPNTISNVWRLGADDTAPVAIASMPRANGYPIRCVRVQ